MKRPSGFTLIELIMVIVILGILAATAAPKFANLNQEAEGSALKAIRGAMESAVSMAHGIWLAQGLNPSSDVLFTNGNYISMVYGYPAATATGIFATLDLSPGKYSWDSASGVIVSGVVYKTVVGAASASTCGVQYIEASAVNFPPIVSAPIYSGC
jgi:MSHA pilin protein MshA